LSARPSAVEFARAEKRQARGAQQIVLPAAQLNSASATTPRPVAPLQLHHDEVEKQEYFGRNDAKFTTSTTKYCVFVVICSIKVRLYKKANKAKNDGGFGGVGGFGGNHFAPHVGVVF
jgi:hypothetical protein